MEYIGLKHTKLEMFVHIKVHPPLQHPDKHRLVVGTGTRQLLDKNNFPVTTECSPRMHSNAVCLSVVHPTQFGPPEGTEKR